MHLDFKIGTHGLCSFFINGKEEKVSDAGDSVAEAIYETYTNVLEGKDFETTFWEEGSELCFKFEKNLYDYAYKVFVRDDEDFTKIHYTLCEGIITKGCLKEQLYNILKYLYKNKKKYEKVMGDKLNFII